MNCIGNAPTGLIICISAILIFFCIFNICNLVEDRIQFYPLKTVSYMSAGFTLNSLQITTHGSEISNAVTYIIFWNRPKNQFLSFPDMFSNNTFGLFVNIMHMCLGLQYYMQPIDFKYIHAVNDYCLLYLLLLFFPVETFSTKVSVAHLMIQTEQAIHFSLEPKIVMIMGKNEIYFVQVSNIKKNTISKRTPLEQTQYKTYYCQDTVFSWYTMKKYQLRVSVT